MAAFLTMEQIEEMIEKSMSKAVSKAVDEAVSKAVSKAVDDSVSKAVDEAVSKAVTKAVDEAVSKAVSEAVAPVVTELRTLSGRVETLSGEMRQLSNKVGVLTAKQHNSLVGRSDLLQKVPLHDGSLPEGDYPRTIMEVIVPGNEALPDGSMNMWNKSKSRCLLHQYQDDSGEESGTDDEQSSRSLARRLRLARCLGISNIQLNFAQISL
ncbi:hypothetical protein VOLCADRAFT_107108 [Volvox carteri f. nagariensis]|uniref:Uncharacterized protein n=1 Tax=Volvox carteri f. nagariensis TaxID=3068 RepID=D8UBZ9_VOLCA|nr:uncharacterized protein VOLCADRAFT_107108 [Volvox carteri f. nagariensis]EFJ42759.1 hypothetical protein VOLCADRAFT_107108 [Volvox carteri f. nagariensis]|eukprot:XP_002956220.1 hypothetical protein VOLCADRAFT_107108 [Volvox carteri f. nagariensis]